MSGDSFLLNYLYGPAAALNGWRSADTAELPAIPGRRAPAHLAKRFSQVMVSLMTEALEPHGLTPPQWGVMVAIIREPGTDQRRVAERQGIDANSASRLIDELEQLRLVRRVASPIDRRSNQLELTAAGRRLRAKAAGPVIAAQDSALACLDEAEKTTLLNLLTRVVEANMAHARPGVGRRKPVRRSAPPQPAHSA
jgi:DNA-binding MarR family transcriptional regulator